MKPYFVSLFLLIGICPLVAQSYFKKIDTLITQGALDEALGGLEEMLLVENASQEAKVLRRIGEIKREQSQYTEAIEALQKAEEYWYQNNSKNEELPKLYYLLASTYSEIGDVEKAKTYLENQIQLATQLYGQQHELVGDAYLQMTKVGYQLKNSELALEGALKVLDIYKAIFEEGHIKIGNAYNNAGLIYELGKKDYERALDFYQKALSIKQEKLGDNHPSTNRTLINIAYIYREAKKNYPKAISLYKKNLAVLRERYGEKQTDVAVAYYTLASTYLDINHADSALFFAQRAIIAAHPDFNDLTYDQQPDQISTIVTDYLIDIIEIKAKAFVLRFENSKNLNDLDKSLAAFDAALSIALQIRDYFRSSDESKLVLQDYLYPLYESALNAAFQAWVFSKDKKYLNHAFQYIEQSKSLLLNQAFRQIQAPQILDVPAHLMEEGQAFQAALLNTEQDEATMLSTKKAYDAWLQNLKKNYPSYYELSYGYNIIKLNKLQDQLSNQQSLINYFEGDSTIFAMVVEADQSKFYRLTKPENFSLSVEAFRESITNYYLKKGETPWAVYQKEQESLSKSLYRQLIQPFGKLKEQLIIIPDGSIAYLAFDALMDESGKYLIHEQSISYAYSTTLLSEMQKQKSNASLQWLGVAPLFMEEESDEGIAVRNSFAPLPFSKKEVESIRQIMDGELLLGQEATIEQFFAKSKAFNCIHLSSHSYFSDQDPSKSYIAFSDTLLYARDLYAKKIPADLVVLSACETNMGNRQRGEGIMSMGRAFTYAGARSLLTTLWPVKDGTTAKFMELFYEYLQNGMDKAEALRQTKLHFIQNQETPFFWAAYQINGDVSIISAPSPQPPWPYLFVMLVLGIFIWSGNNFFQKRWNKNV